MIQFQLISNERERLNGIGLTRGSLLNQLATRNSRETAKNDATRNDTKIGTGTESSSMFDCAKCVSWCLNLVGYID